MPTISTYGLRVTLQPAAPSGPYNNDPTTANSALEESDVFQTWLPTKGMTHPIYTSTVVTPQATNTMSTNIPFKIVVEFTPDEDMPPYMRGDIRVEALVDGIPCGLRVFREVKLRGKGFRVEFAGFRVGRTEERPLVFHKLPKHLLKDSPSSKVENEQDDDNEGLSDQGRIYNPGAVWTQNAISLGAPDYEPTGNDGCRFPEKPGGVPRHVSHIEVLVSVGKKFLTLEKYFMAGASQTTAFYHPPKPWTPLDPKEWRPPGKTSPGKGPKLAGALGPQMKAFGKRTVIQRAPEDHESTSESPLTVGTKTFLAAEKPATWRPIGLSSQPKKCQQAKEVEFSARLHLVRFWIFVVPNSEICSDNIPPAMTSSNRTESLSHRVVLHVCPEKLQRFTGAQSGPGELLTPVSATRPRFGISPERGGFRDDVSDVTDRSTSRSFSPRESVTSLSESQSTIHTDEYHTDMVSYRAPMTPSSVAHKSTRIYGKRLTNSLEENEFRHFTVESANSLGSGARPYKRARRFDDLPISGHQEVDEEEDHTETAGKFISFD